MSNKLLSKLLLPSLKCATGCNAVLARNSASFSKNLVCSHNAHTIIGSTSISQISTLKFHTSSFTNNENESQSGRKPKIDYDPKDRTKVIPVETSMKYLKSEEYQQAYGDEPVWVKYRRNFAGQYLPQRTRKKCIKNDRIVFGSPCPICRDEYLVVDYQNIELLKQFISPETDRVFPSKKTQICQQQQLKMKVAVAQARDVGLLTYYVPFREYDYEEYKPQS